MKEAASSGFFYVRNMSKGVAMVAVVLLGAGASFGSEDALETPPLGKDLFNKLQEKSVVAAGLPQEIKALFVADFEAGMAEYIRYSKGDVIAFQRDLAHYLASFQPGERNVYINLIETLGVRRVIYCSLNYDLLFEQAAAMLGLQIIYGPDRLDPRAPRLLKPHGSSNFWPAIGKSTFQNFRRENCGVLVHSRVETVGRNETLARCVRGDVLAPAMSLYEAEKTDLVCPDMVTGQLAQWRASANRATNIFIVGVRVHTVDDHIWGVLAACRSPVTYYGASERDRIEFDNWVQATGKHNARFETADFAKSVPLMRMRLFGR